MQSPLPMTGNADATSNPRDEIPIGRSGVGLRGGATVDRDRCGAGVLDHAAPAPAR